MPEAGGKKEPPEGKSMCLPFDGGCVKIISACKGSGRHTGALLKTSAAAARLSAGVLFQAGNIICVGLFVSL